MSDPDLPLRLLGYHPDIAGRDSVTATPAQDGCLLMSGWSESPYMTSLSVINAKRYYVGLFVYVLNVFREVANITCARFRHNPHLAASHQYDDYRQVMHYFIPPYTPAHDSRDGVARFWYDTNQLEVWRPLTVRQEGFLAREFFTKPTISVGFFQIYDWTVWTFLAGCLLICSVAVTLLMGGQQGWTKFYCWISKLTYFLGCHLTLGDVQFCSLELDGCRDGFYRRFPLLVLLWILVSWVSCIVGTNDLITILCNSPVSDRFTSWTDLLERNPVGLYVLYCRGSPEDYLVRQYTSEHPGFSLWNATINTVNDYFTKPWIEANILEVMLSSDASGERGLIAMDTLAIRPHLVRQYARDPHRIQGMYESVIPEIPGRLSFVATSRNMPPAWRRVARRIITQLAESGTFSWAVDRFDDLQLIFLTLEARGGRMTAPGEVGHMYRPPAGSPSMTFESLTLDDLMGVFILIACLESALFLGVLLRSLSQVTHWPDVKLPFRLKKKIKNLKVKTFVSHEN